MTQLVINILISASQYMLVAVGFALILHVGRFFHFAHGAVFVIGAYSAYVFSQCYGSSLPVMLLIGGSCAACVGMLIELGIYRPLRRRGASSVILLLASLGTYVTLQNAVSLAFGDDARALRWGRGSAPLEVFGGHLMPVHVVTLACAVATTIALGLVWRGSLLGKRMRAVASDRELAIARGIHVDRVMLVVFMLASFLAGVGGVLVGLDAFLAPQMALRMLFMAVVAVVVGGGRSILGVGLGALVVAVAEHSAAWFWSSQWQDAVAFAILLVFLLVRPQGLFGKPLRKVAI